MSLKKETWQQDPYDPALWHGENGVIVNTAALEARAPYVEVVRQHAFLAPLQIEDARYAAVS